MALNVNAKAGDESRRNGDYISFPTQESDDTELGSQEVPVGVPVTVNGSGNLAEVTDFTDSGKGIVGVLYEYDVYGGNQGSNNRVLIDADSEATVKTRGAVYADLSDASSPSVGDRVGANGELVVVNETQSSGIYEVLVR